MTDELMPQEEPQDTPPVARGRSGRGSRNALWLAVWIVAGVVVIGVVFLGLASGINAIARWNAGRAAEAKTAARLAALRARENLLVIGADNTSSTAGFLALRVNAKGGQVFGLAIPDGAFIEVPGRGFERAADAYAQGTEISMSAITNFLGVPFQRYVVVPVKEYQRAVKEQSIDRILDAATSSNLSEDEKLLYAKGIQDIDQENVAIMPLPVKPISLGSNTYFEPQLDQIADVIKQWWGVDPSKQAQVPRIIVYNGAGVPGIAGEAAQDLIRAGFRVVDTRNADRFDYQESVIVLQNGTDETAVRVREVLGGGKIVKKPAEQEIADLIVIVGKDYKKR